MGSQLPLLQHSDPQPVGRIEPCRAIHAVVFSMASGSGNGGIMVWGRGWEWEWEWEWE